MRVLTENHALLLTKLEDKTNEWGSRRRSPPCVDTATPHRSSIFLSGVCITVYKDLCLNYKWLIVTMLFSFQINMAAKVNLVKPRASVSPPVVPTD